MSLAADGQVGNRLQLERLRLNFSSCFRASSKKLVLMAVVSGGLFPICELSLYLPLDVQILCCTWDFVRTLLKLLLGFLAYTEHALAQDRKRKISSDISKREVTKRT